MATLSRGQTFGATETITNTKLHALVDSGSVTGIINSDIDAAAAIANSKLANIVDSGKVSGSSIFNLASLSGAGVIPMENLTNSVLLATLQTIPSLKYFATLPIYPSTSPTVDGQASNKSYVDTQVATTALSSILDYTTSASSGSAKTQASLKICYGRITISATSSQAITNLPFTSSSSYQVTTTPTSAPGANGQHVTYASGASFTIFNAAGDERSISWIAIGT